MTSLRDEQSPSFRTVFVTFVILFRQVQIGQSVPGERIVY